MAETQTDLIVPERLARFREVYHEELRKARAAKPTDYFWPEEKLGEVVDKMIDAVRRGSFQKEGVAFRATFRKLGIKDTYKAVAAWLRGVD